LECLGTLLTLSVLAGRGKLQQALQHRLQRFRRLEMAQPGRGWDGAIFDDVRPHRETHRAGKRSEA
jgi:hypothetical protein